MFFDFEMMMTVTDIGTRNSKEQTYATNKKGNI